MSSRNERGCACVARRGVLKAFLAALPACAFPAAALAQAPDRRRLRLVNTHTGEELDEPYFENGEYLPQPLGHYDWLLRDHRTGEVLPIDQRLLDLLVELAAQGGVEPQYWVISGYRSPATNAMLAATTDGVSSQSLHMAGRAIDVRPVGMTTAALRDLALARQAGGVGYYEQSDFVHVDTGRVRSWTG